MRGKSIIVFLCLTGLISGQKNEWMNPVFLQFLCKDSSYLALKAEILKKYCDVEPHTWCEYMKTIDLDSIKKKKIIALSFDACGGPGGNKYDSALINYLRKEKVPASLFVTGRWIDANYNTFLKLTRDSLFEIENHGFNHRPCSVDGDIRYGIKGTQIIADAFDEIEANARKIERITGRRPLFYRSATAYADEPCSRMAHCLNMTLISFDVLSCDAMPQVSVETINSEVLRHIKPGAVVIMHFNHPVWNTYESLKILLPELRRRGYSFSKLQDYPVKHIADTMPIRDTARVKEVDVK